MLRSGRRTGLVLVVLCLAAFALSLRGGFAWDDGTLIVHNPLLQTTNLRALLTGDFWASAGGAASDHYSHGLYRPVVTLFFFVERHLFGLRGGLFHLGNVLLHAACVLLAWRWLRRRLPGTSTPVLLAALGGAALFAVHPSRSEAVGWISGATELCWVFFALLGFEARAARTRWGRVGLASVCFVLALLSKETAAVCVALVVGDAWLLDEAHGGGHIEEALVVAGITSAALVARLAWRHGGEAVAFDPFRSLALLGRHLERVVPLSPPSVLLTAGAPAGSGLHGFATMPMVVGALALAGASLVLLVAITRPGWRPVAADLAWLLLPLVPVAGLFHATGLLVCERYLYAPLLGACALAGRAFVQLVERRPGTMRVATIAGVATVFASMLVTATTVDRFRSSDAMWAYEEQLDPQHGMPPFERAKIAREEGRVADAAEHYRRASEVVPSLSLKLTMALDGVRLLAETTPDADQSELVSLRAFVDRLLGSAPGEARLVLGRGELAFSNGAVIAAKFPIDPTLDVRLHLRTGDLVGATREASEWLEARPNDAQLRALVTRARALAQQPTTAALLPGAAARAGELVTLGAPILAKELLDGSPSTPDVVAARAAVQRALARPGGWP